MDKIKGYINRFFKGKEINDDYDMLVSERKTLVKEARQQTETVDIVNVTFRFGYAKGYRAALAEMKKGGRGIMQITKTLNKAEATELFEKEAILIGHDNAIPFYRAVELFGEWAAEFIDRCMEEHSYLDFGGDYSGWGLSERRPYTEYFYKPGFMKLVCEYNYLQIVKAHEESESGQLIDKYTAERRRRRDEQEAEEERKRAERKAKRAAAKAAKEAAKKEQEGQLS